MPWLIMMSDTNNEQTDKLKQNYTQKKKQPKTTTRRKNIEILKIDNMVPMPLPWFIQIFVCFFYTILNSINRRSSIFIIVGIFLGHLYLMHVWIPLMARIVHCISYHSLFVVVLLFSQCIQCTYTYLVICFVCFFFAAAIFLLSIFRSLMHF